MANKIPRLRKKDSVDLRQKSDVVTAAINAYIENDTPISKINYQYLHDITKYLTHRKLRNNSLAKAQLLDDVIQTVMENIYKIVILEKRYPNIKSIFAFTNQAVKLEMIKSLRSKYLGKMENLGEITPVSGNNPDNEEIYGEALYKGVGNMSELELFFNLHGSIYNITHLIKRRLAQSNLDQENIKLLVFPTLLYYIREENSLIKKFPPKIKTVIKEITIYLNSLHERKYV